MAFVRRITPKKFDFTTRDVWGFHPKDYVNKWVEGKGKIEDPYFQNLAPRLLNKFGKPFILTQTNPLHFDLKKGGELPQAQYGTPINKAYNNAEALNDKGFQNWYEKNTLEGKNGSPYTDSQNYDYYSFYKNKGEGNIKEHFPDTYKRPSHPTFSNESIYSTPENPGGSWEGEKYTPDNGLRKKAQVGGSKNAEWAAKIRSSLGPEYANYNDEQIRRLYSSKGIMTKFGEDGYVAPELDEFTVTSETDKERRDAYLS
jgi:hypothetical protein